ncbi:DUF6274 family protein [Streptomyces sp. NPDC003036]|uniref:DUF6274 family protein n=1 Tax=Streptomyces sp. NPDC003036 TaxID=3154442 RepID=UPI00339EAB80
MPSTPVRPGRPDLPDRPVRHETRALLRAHLAAASGYRHVTPRCVVCRRLQRLAMEAPDDGGNGPDGGTEDPFPELSAV